MNKNIKIIKSLLLILSLSFIIVFIFPKETYKEFWSISWFLLILVMFIRPLKDVFPKCKLFSFLLKLRRELWILVWVFWLAHGIGSFLEQMIFINYTKTYIELFFDPYVWKYTWYIFWWMMAFLVSIPLLITSNGISTKILGKKWKILQRLSYFMFVFVAIHIALIHGFEVGPFIPVIAWIVLFIIAHRKNKKALNNTSNWSKRLCVPCGYIYDETIWDPDSGIAPGTRFEDIPADWRCPVCWVGKSDFVLVEWEIKLHDAQIISLEYQTEDVIELQVDVKNEYVYTPWQFITFGFHDNNGDFNRSYSIASKVGNVFMFLIKIKKDGRAGQIFPTLKVWDKMKFTSVSGSFKLLDTKKPKVFIATGTGLAPIFAMLLATPVDVPKKIYFWVATKKDLFYIQELQQFQNLEIKTCISREEVEWCHFGRIDLSNESFEPNTEFYLCGNPWVVQTAKEVLNSKWFSNVFSEEF